jgi:hypothetical protein
MREPQPFGTYLSLHDSLTQAEEKIAHGVPRVRRRNGGVKCSDGREGGHLGVGGGGGGVGFSTR